MTLELRVRYLSLPPMLVCWSALRVTMVHFRCSDTPFVRKSGHLQRKGYWDFVAAQIVAQGGGKRVVFTLCTEWLAETGARAQCPAWLRQSQRWLQQALPTGQGYSVDPTPRCWSVRTTWWLFLSASMLVSGIESVSHCPANVAK